MMFNNGGKPPPSEDARFETGGRVLKEKTAPDENDDFSQDAATNKKPPLGLGLTERNSERSDADKSDLDDSDLTGKLRDADSMPQDHEDPDRRL